MSALAEALLAFQKDAPSIQRDAINPHFRSRYVSNEALTAAVLPIASACGLVINQFVTYVREPGAPSQPALRTRITHAESGEWMEDVMLLMPGKNDPQGQGSAITYARRYSLMSALGLVADEDDDGNAATKSAGAGTGTPAPAETNGHVAETPTGPFTPSEMVVHWSKHKGKKLGELSAQSLSWFATKWELQDTPSDYDHYLKAAAVALNSGDDSPISPDPYPDVPFG